MKRSIIVVDNFLDNPEEMRELALKGNYEHKGTYPGHDTKTPDIAHNELAQKIARVMGASIRPRFMGNFRLSVEGDTATRHIHTDSTDIQVANICLALDKDCKGGLALWQHKETGIYIAPDTNEQAKKEFGFDLAYIEEKLTLTDGQDESKWTQVGFIPYRFNRCVIINGRQFHSPWPQGWGDSPENGRLTQHFFFDLV